MASIQHIYRQPLFQFFVIGLLLFIIDGNLNSNSNSDAYEIVVDGQTKNAILNRFEKQWKRKPNEIEFANLVNDHVKQEIFYREALQLDLDKNDEIIKRRLYQKMEVLLKDFEPKAMAYDSVQARRYYDEHIGKYSTPERFSFYQIGVDSKTKALELLSTLNMADSEASDQKDLNKIDLFPFFIADVSSTQLESQFGGSLPDEITQSTDGVWSGPFQSGFGWHLIFLTDKVPSQPIAFENVQHNVVNDLQYAIEKENQENLYNELKKKYQIIEQ